MKVFFETLAWMVKRGIKTDTVPTSVSEERMETCHVCEDFKEETKQCGICKCFLPVKTRLVFDPFESAKQESHIKTHCPINKWTEYQSKI